MRIKFLVKLKIFLLQFAKKEWDWNEITVLILYCSQGDENFKRHGKDLIKTCCYCLFFLRINRGGKEYLKQQFLASECSCVSTSPTGWRYTGRITILRICPNTVSRLKTWHRRRWAPITSRWMVIFPLSRRRIRTVVRCNPGRTTRRIASRRKHKTSATLSSTKTTSATPVDATSSRRQRRSSQSCLPVNVVGSWSCGGYRPVLL